MKTEKHLFEKVASMDNIINAIHKAATNKRNRPEVIEVLKNPDKYAKIIYRQLWTKSYIPCIPVESKVKEGSRQKERTVTNISFFPDQIIHWAIVLQIQGPITKSAYAVSCGCMPGRGVHYGKKFLERWIRSDRINTKYCAKLDIAKFYPSIQHNLAKKRFRVLTKDNKMLWLLDSIVDCYSPGLPIGFLTSQWFSNYILQNLDYFIKQKLKTKYYLRYMDDLVLFGRNKKELHRSIRSIAEFLEKEDLKLKENWQLFKLDKRALDVMGFRFYRNKTTLRKSLMLRISRKAAKIHKKGVATPKDAASMLSYMGWIKHSDTRSFHNHRVKKRISIKVLKKIVSGFSKGEIKKNENCRVRKQRIPISA